jgi:hypothetical protein
MRPFFSSGGGIGATVEAARGRPAAAPCLASVREAEAHWGGKGKLASWKKKKNGPRLGRKAGWAKS